MIDALAYVQHTMGRSVDAAQGILKDFQRWLVGLGLLRSDDGIELNSQLRARAGEECVIDIRNNRQPKAGLELA
jgi:hypothetical protein